MAYFWRNVWTAQFQEPLYNLDKMGYDEPSDDQQRAVNEVDKYLSH